MPDLYEFMRNTLELHGYYRAKSGVHGHKPLSESHGKYPVREDEGQRQSGTRLQSVCGGSGRCFYCPPGVGRDSVGLSFCSCSRRYQRLA